jgi:hypothetical protein
MEAPTSYWYPNVRLVRQTRSDDWGPVVGQVKAALAARAGARAAA